MIVWLILLHFLCRLKLYYIVFDRLHSQLLCLLYLFCICFNIYYICLVNTEINRTKKENKYSIYSIFIYTYDIINILLGTRKAVKIMFFSGFSVFCVYIEVYVIHILFCVYIYSYVQCSTSYALSSLIVLNEKQKKLSSQFRFLQLCPLIQYICVCHVKFVCLLH